MKLKKILLTSILAVGLSVAFAIATFAVTPDYVCSDCGASLTYESDDGERVTITHPSGTCQYSGQTVKGNVPAWAKYKNSSGTGGDGTSGDGDSTTTEEDYGIAGFMLDTIFGTSSSDSDSLVGDLANPLQLLADSVDDGEDNGVIPMMDQFTGETFYYTIQAIGITMVLFYFMSGLLTRDLSQHFGKPTLEMLARPFGRVIIVIAFIVFAWDICKVFLALSQYALLSVADLAGSTMLSGVADMKKVVMESCGWKSTQNVGTLDKIFNSMGNIGVTIQVVIAFLIPFVGSLFCNVAAIWVVLSRTVNLTIYTIMAPISLSDLYGEQHFKDTHAFGWLKKYFAICMQSVVIVLMYYITNKICGQFMTKMFESVNASGSTLGFGQVVNFATYVFVLKVVQIGAVVGSLHKVQEMIV